MTPADLASLSNAVAADSDATKPRSGEWHALRRAASEAAKALSYALKEAARRGTTVDESRYVVGIHPQAALRLVLDMRRVAEALTEARRVLAACEWDGCVETGSDRAGTASTANGCAVCHTPWVYHKPGTPNPSRHAPDCALAAALGVVG